MIVLVAFIVVGNIEVVETLSAFGAFFGGVGGLLAAIAAYNGVNVWRSQVLFGKYISIIWDCEKSLRELELRYISWSIKASSCALNEVLNPDYYKKYELESEDIRQKLEVLESAFSSLDSVVEKKNGYEWVNYFSLNIEPIISEYEHKCKQKLGTDNHTKLQSELADLTNTFMKNAKYLHGKLEELENKYRKI